MHSILKVSIFSMINSSNRGSVVESQPANAGDTDSIPDLGRSHMPWSN